MHCHNRRTVWVALVLLGPMALGCAPAKPTSEVVIYCALDRGFSEPILEEYQKQTGVRVRAVYDTESTKSVGLRERILKEKSRPRCDVFWNNEILNTLRLAEEGVLAPYQSPVGKQYPASCQAADDTWYGFAGRIRVLLVNTEKVSAPPRTLEELTDDKWKDQVGIAKPLFGTTATHVACLFAVWGPDRTKDWLRRLKENGVQVLSGNRQVAIQVGAGGLPMGLTDTDDALAELAAGKPVKMIFIESSSDHPGILTIPNALSLIKGGPNPEEGKRLIDYLLSPAIEEKLATGASGQIPMHPEAKADPKLGVPDDAKTLQVDFSKALTHWDEAMQYVKDEFTAP